VTYFNPGKVCYLLNTAATETLSTSIALVRTQITGEVRTNERPLASSLHSTIRRQSCGRLLLPPLVVLTTAERRRATGDD